MNLYLLSQSVNNDYDTYDSVVVADESDEDAKTIHPNGGNKTIIDGLFQPIDYFDTWAPKLSDIEVKLICKAVDGTVRGVVLASFNAG